MNKMHLLASAVAIALLSSVAVAQTTTPEQRGKIDANGDGAIDSTEAAKFPRLAARFGELDADKDGKLSRAELPRHKTGKHRGGRARMHAMDTDKDGRISKAEAQASANQFASRFDGMDVNKDGYLDREDMRIKVENARAEFFAGADVDRNGRLTRDEFIVEQGARSAERREQFRQRAGKDARVASEDERIQRAGAAFDRIDTNRDGSVSKAEYDAFKPMRDGGRHKAPRVPKG